MHKQQQEGIEALATVLQARKDQHKEGLEGFGNGSLKLMAEMAIIFLSLHLRPPLFQGIFAVRFHGVDACTQLLLCVSASVFCYSTNHTLCRSASALELLAGEEPILMQLVVASKYVGLRLGSLAAVPSSF